MIVVIMAEQIKLFGILTKVRQSLKIYPPKSDRKFQFNWGNLLFILPLLALLTSEALYFLFEATSIAEYGICFYLFSLALTNIIYYSINVIKMRDILTLVGRFEDFIEMSKCLSGKLEGDLFSDFSFDQF